MIDSFLKYLQYEKRLSPNTVLAYQIDLQQLSDFLIKEHAHHEISTASYSLIRTWIVSLVESGLEAASVNRKIACLRSFFKFLLKQEVISKDPMSKITVLKAKKRLPRFVKEDDMVNLLDNQTFDETFEGQRNRLILEIFYCTGIRLSELINLKERSIDLTNRTFKVLGKRNKERVIPFSASLVPLIENYISIRNREIEMKDHGNLFVRDDGQACYPMMIYKIVKKYLDQFPGVEQRSPHFLHC